MATISPLTFAVPCPGSPDWDTRTMECNPIYIQINDCVIRLELDGAVNVTRELTDVERTMLDDPENWKWGPLAKALLRSRNFKGDKPT